MINKKFKHKKLIVFDLDGTLAETKSAIDAQISSLLKQLLDVTNVAVISGAKMKLFKQQFLRALRAPAQSLKHLFLFPTTGTAFYRYNHGWKKIYQLQLSLKDRRLIKKTFREVLAEIGYTPPAHTYGTIIEDRGTQVTFSALGQEVVAMVGKKKGVALKQQWKREHTDTKMKIARLVATRLPHLEIHAAGYTSIDVTHKGIDKGYGIRQMEKHLKIPRKQMLFIGDAIFPGGNDYAVVKTGVDYCKVKNPTQTKQLIKNILSNI